ncbi:MAG: hypothetical protein ACI9K2_005925 [Myxococcota bacterium]
MAFQTFAVDLDREHHTLSMGLDVADGSSDLVFKNWRERMRREHPPGSLTATREAGQAQWSAALVSLDFANATVLPLVDTGRIDWKGWGRNTNSPEAEAPGELVYAQRSDAAVGLADHPIEVAGTRLESVRGRKADFKPRRNWSKTGRKRRDVLQPFCDQETAPPADLPASLAQVVELATLLATVGARADDAPPFLPSDLPEITLDKGVVVRGSDIAPPGATGGGYVFTRPVRSGWEAFGEDWWVQQGATVTELGGRLSATATGATRWSGRAIWSGDDMPRHTAVQGSLELGPSGPAQTLKATLAVPCDGEFKVTAVLREASDCPSWDGRIASATVRSRRHEATFTFDDVCDGCDVPGGACAERMPAPAP